MTTALDTSQRPPQFHPDYLVGNQEPSCSHVPSGDPARAIEALWFIRDCGGTLYPWQEDLVFDMLLTRTNGTWASREVVVPLARQNGKGEVLVWRELVGIYLLGERRILHTAHFLDTAVDARDRLWDIISNNPELMGWWADEFPGKKPQLIKTNGKDAIVFPNGAKIYFRTRTKKTGRGLSIDLLVFDECFDLPNEVYSAMNSTTKARPNAQKVFISSPVNRYEHLHGAVFSAKRWQGVDGSPGVLFKEWTIDPKTQDPFDPETWSTCDPSLVTAPVPGVQFEEVQSEAQAARNSEDLLETFLVETLGVGYWVPRDNDTSDFEPIVPFEDWKAAQNSRPATTRDCAIALDISPDGSQVALVSAARTRGGGFHLRRSPLNQFDVDETQIAIQSAVHNNDPLAVVMDSVGPATVMQRPIHAIGVEPDLMRARTVVAALQLFLQLFREGKISHDGDPRWLEELQVAEFREVGETGRALTRRTGSVMGLVAATFAIWGLRENEIPRELPDSANPTKFVGRPKKVSTARARQRRDFDF